MSAHLALPGSGCLPPKAKRHGPAGEGLAGNGVDMDPSIACVRIECLIDFGYIIGLRHAISLRLNNENKFSTGSL